MTFLFFLVMAYIAMFLIWIYSEHAADRNALYENHRRAQDTLKAHYDKQEELREARYKEDIKDIADRWDGRIADLDEDFELGAGRLERERLKADRERMKKKLERLQKNFDAYRNNMNLLAQWAHFGEAAIFNATISVPYNKTITLFFASQDKLGYKTIKISLSSLQQLQSMKQKQKELGFNYIGWGVEAPQV